MEGRWYFQFGDLMSNAGVGALVGSVVAMLVGQAWHPVLGMVVGMLGGGEVALPATVVTASETETEGECSDRRALTTASPFRIIRSVDSMGRCSAPIN